MNSYYPCIPFINVQKSLKVSLEPGSNLSYMKFYASSLFDLYSKNNSQNKRFSVMMRGNYPGPNPIHALGATMIPPSTAPSTLPLLLGTFHPGQYSLWLDCPDEPTDQCNGFVEIIGDVTTIL